MDTGLRTITALFAALTFAIPMTWNIAKETTTHTVYQTETISVYQGPGEPQNGQCPIVQSSYGTETIELPGDKGLIIENGKCWTIDHTEQRTTPHTETKAPMPWVTPITIATGSIAVLGASTLTIRRVERAYH